MSAPTRVQLKYWFYPTGNTPAVNFLRDLPAADGKEHKSEVLSLACGDPRNVLFSLWCEQAYDSNRRITFTCCDIEPAVLARNVMLFTLIADKVTTTKGNEKDIRPIWDLFYHFFVPKSSLMVLQSQVSKLLTASESSQAWAASTYGKFIGYLDEATLLQLRSYWAHYAETNTNSRDSEARMAIAKRAKEVQNFYMGTGLRAAGPFWTHALETMAHVYRKYWETGVAGGNLEDVTLLEEAGKGLVNPMFAVSGAPARDFAVHYGTDPLLGFHLAEAFQDAASQGSNTIERAKRVVEVAKSEFRDWCLSFKSHVQKGCVRINLFHGDALALGHELQMGLVSRQGSAKVASTYIKPWSARPLVIDGFGTSGRGPFDVIDTSNVGDHVGLINILSAVTPLLRLNASSTIYTESLLMASEDVTKSLSIVLGSDVTTFSLLIGLAPVGLLTGVTMDAVSNEAARAAMAQTDEGHQRQHRVRVSWKVPELGDPAATKRLEGSKHCRVQAKFEAKELAAYLFEIYKAMFAHEDLSKLMARRQQHARDRHYSTDLPRYTRAGLVALLRLVKVKALVNWEQTIHFFLAHVDSDKSLLVGGNSIQEFYMHLHVSALWTSQALEDGPRQNRTTLELGLRDRSGEKGLLAELNIPAVVNLVLVIPRKQLKVFTSETPDDVGTPGLHVSITGGQSGGAFENCFFSFHCFFGKINHRASNADVAVAEEDHSGWLGTGDLIVACLVPAFILLLGPRNNLRIRLAVTTSPDTVSKFTPSLGLRMAIFETGLKDEKRLFVCRNAPMLDTVRSHSAHREWLEKSASRNQSSFQTYVRLSGEHKATHLQNHIDFPQGSTESMALSSNVNVTTAEVSPCTLLVLLGTALKRQFVYPFPIKGSQTKVRVARKSSWIEVEVPIYTALDGEKFDSWTQMVFEPGSQPVCWSIPRVNLAIQRPINFAGSADSSWLSVFMGSSMSDSEMAANTGKQNTSSNVKLELKQSLSIIFSSFAGLNEQSKGPVKTFCLTTARNKSCHTILFATAICHDLDLGSLVMDAFVVPLTTSRCHELRTALGSLQGTEPCSVLLSNEESTLWKRMLPALAERCRTWSHKATCEYIRDGAPRSTEDDQNPLCTCGEGKATSNDLKKTVKQWAPFAKYATRIAMAPIFPVPYVEPSMSEIRRRVRAVVPVPTPRQPAGGGSASTPRGAARPPVGFIEKCDHCGREGDRLQVCGGCKKVRYCGKECQKAARKEHKMDCVKG